MTAQARFRQKDIERALKAAKNSGFDAVKVRIDSSGRMEIIAGRPANEGSADLELD